MDSAAPEADGRPRTLSPDDAKAANDAFSNALQLLRDRALSEPPSAAGPSPEQQVYAQALGWQSAALAKTQRSGSRRRSSPSAGNDATTRDDSNLCAVQLIRDDADIPYPDDALERFGVGAVVVQLGLDSEGSTTSATIAAPSPPGVLSVAVAAVMQDWRTQRDPNAAPACRMPGSLFVPVPFVRD
jgi:outer membrane biosynthesis protein TonB